jgi:excisionase family DNA binding protein
MQATTKPDQTRGEADPNALLTTKQACEYLHVSAPTLRKIARRCRMKRVMLTAKAVRYRKEELDRCAEERTRTLR